MLRGIGLALGTRRSYLVTFLMPLNQTGIVLITLQIQNKTQEDIWIVVLSWVRMTWGNSCDVAWPWPRPHIPPLVRPHSLLSLADESLTRVLIGQKRLRCQGRVRPQATHTAALRRITRAWDAEWGDAFLDSVMPRNARQIFGWAGHFFIWNWRWSW